MASNKLHLCEVSNNVDFQVSKQWDPKVTGGSCLTAVPMYTTMASITIIFDVLMYVLDLFRIHPLIPASMLAPFPMLLKSQLQTRKKVIILGLFSLGIFITIIQIVRILTIKSLSNSIDSGPLIMWSMVENNLGIIVASIPPLSPLVRAFREATSYNRSNKGRNGSRGLSYAMHTMNGPARDRDGHMHLGSGNDIDTKDNSMVVVSGGQMDNSSEEFIFQNSTSHVGIGDRSIYQKTEITITAESKR